MAEFLSEAWIAELDRAARSAAALAALGDGDPLVIEQRVRGHGDEVVYHLEFAREGARVRGGPAAAPDLVVLTDAATARALQLGTLNAQQAAVDGRLKIRGRVGRLRDAGDALRSVDDVFETVRAETTYAQSGDEDARRGGR